MMRALTSVGLLVSSLGCTGTGRAPVVPAEAWCRTPALTEIKVMPGGSASDGWVELRMRNGKKVSRMATFTNLNRDGVDDYVIECTDGRCPTTVYGSCKGGGFAVLWRSAGVVTPTLSPGRRPPAGAWQPLRWKRTTTSSCLLLVFSGTSYRTTGTAVACDAAVTTHLNGLGLPRHESARTAQLVAGFDSL